MTPTPSFSDFFKSLYYSNTYVSPVDLSDQALSKHLLENEDKKTASAIQDLISDPEVQSVLSEPLTYDLQEAVPRNNKVLLSRGFKILSTKTNLLTSETVPFYSVSEHQTVPGFIIKAGAMRIPKGQLMLSLMNDRNEMAFFKDEESILRIEMVQRIAEVAREANIDIVLPKKKLVAYKNLDGITEVTRKYCVVCQKINVLSLEETVDAIKKMGEEQQKDLARKLSIIVQKAGLCDASFHNIRLTPEGKIAFIDTEPAGLMIAKTPGLWNSLFGENGASVEKCARIGLATLMNQTLKISFPGHAASQFDGSVEPGLEIFHEQIKNDYEASVSPKLSKWKIVLSILSLGLIPLINVIIALVKVKLAKNNFEELMKIDQPFARTARLLNFKPLEEQKRLVKEYQEARTPFAKQYFAYTEGVPFQPVMV